MRRQGGKLTEEDDMHVHDPIAMCCTRPQFKFVGGVDDAPGTIKFDGKLVLAVARLIKRMFVMLRFWPQ